MIITATQLTISVALEDPVKAINNNVIGLRIEGLVNLEIS
jgi:hypothetical protein